MRSRAIRWFVITASVLMTPALFSVLTHGRTALHIAINRFHHALADLFFAPFTHVGDGLTVLALALFFLARSWRSFLMVGLSAAISALITQTLKHTLFSGVDRPIEFLVDMPSLYLVPGVVMNHHHSFPSGHSTAAFSMCCALAVLIARPTWSIVLAITAALIGFSRVYLSQHFTEDVLAGAFIGTSTSMIMYWMLYVGPWAGKTSLDGSLFRRAARSDQPSVPS